MIEVEMSDDIRKYNTKVWGPFTKRQLICIVIGLVYSTPIALLIPVSLDNKMLIWGILIIPALACGYVTLDGAAMEVMLLRIIYLYFLTPARRKCIQKNLFHEEMKQMEKIEEKQKLSRMTNSQRKTYLKKKEKKHVVYSNKKENKLYK